MDLHPPMYLQTYHPDKESKFFIKIKDSPKEDYSKGEGEEMGQVFRCSGFKFIQLPKYKIKL